MAAQQKLVSKVFDVYQEWEDLRALAMTLLGYAYLACGIFMTGLALIRFQDATSLISIVPWVVLLIGGIITLNLKDKRPRITAYLVISVVWIALVTQQLLVEYQENLSYFALFPIFIGLIFVKHQTILKLSLFAVCLVLVMDGITYKTLWISGHTIIIGFLVMVASIGDYLLLYQTQLMVQWAIDSQNKNFIRAESFYEQGEQLRTSLNDLQHANEQLRRLTTELNSAKLVVEEISQAKSTFLSNMSHELRTPLNMVIGYTSSILKMPQMYNNQELPEVFQKDIEIIQSSGQYLLALINDILDLSKIESGKFQINPTAFDLGQVLQGVMATSLGLVKEKSLQLKPDFPEKLPLVWGDPMRIRQILLNLMSNAIKYTHTGSVVLTVKLYETSVEISITDTGVGIPQSTLANIFDRFEQVQNNSNIQGTGLGLDISQRLAHMHGSQITVESSLGIGSTFSFELALATPEQAALYDADITNHHLSGIKRFEPSTANWQEHCTVLIAEDESVTREMLIRIFEAQNYIVFDVQNGNSVLEAASAILPDIIILDIVLPGKDGWTVLDELKNNSETSEIPVIVLSAHLDPEKQRNADVFLEKPISAQKIVDIAGKLVSERAR